MQSPSRSFPRPAARPRPRPAARGVTALLVVVLTFVLLAFVALAVDVARIVTDEQHLRAAADAAALGAVAVVKEDLAPDFFTSRGVAVSLARQNRVGRHPVEVHHDTDVWIGMWDTSASPPVFVPWDEAAPVEVDAVRVRARRDGSKTYGRLQLTFGRIFGGSPLNLVEFATARRAPVEHAHILVLHPTERGSVLLRGNVTLVVQNGVMQVNSSDSRALNLIGNAASLSAALTRVVGGANYNPGMITGHLELGVDPIPDPLATLPDPVVTDQPAGPSGQIDGSKVPPDSWEPGWYPNGINMTSSGSVARLEPGVYRIGSPGTSNGINLMGGRLEGTGVMLFVEQGGSVAVGGNAEVHLTPPSSGPYEGLTVFHHRQNSHSGVFNLAGLGDFEMEGTIYVPGGKLNVDGTPGKEIGRIIVNELEISGTSGFVITGKSLPPATGEEFVYLVE